MIPGMKLEKLTIYIEKQSFKPVEVLFNPNQITITKTAWKSDAKMGLAPSDAPKTLSVELFFDTTLPQPSHGGELATALTATLGRSKLPSIGNPKDVRNHTRSIVQLTEPRGELGKPLRPPICQLQWGKWGGTKSNEGFFQGVLKSLTQTFSRFSSDGTPIRATLACEFEEWEDPRSRAKAQNPVDDPIRIVKRGETLSSIAQEEYGDPSLWRIIANENKLLNPRKIEPGQRLTVPPLQFDSSSRRRY